MITQEYKLGDEDLLSVKKSSLPLCTCGCGKEVKNLKDKFLKGHNRRGLKLSDNQKLKISDQNKTRVGKLNSFFGKKHTLESIDKMSKKHKERIPWNKGLKGSQIGWSKGKKFSEETKLKMSLVHIGKKHSEDQKRKISDSHIGLRLSEETKLKISNNHGRYWLRKNRSQESNSQQSIKMKQYRRNHHIDGWSPCKGRQEKDIFDEIQLYSVYSLLEDQHFLNYYPDRYIKELNIVVEFYENHHKHKNSLEYDFIRQKDLVDYLHCVFFIIHEREWKENKEQVINRFKELIQCLEHVQLIST